MTLEQTRNLGIEFERRVQTMIPEREFIDKLDTETIYSYLNQYQDKYIHDIYRSLDSVPDGSKLSVHIESILQSLLTSCEIYTDGEGNWKFGDTFPESFVEENESPVVDNNNINIIDTARSITFKLPEDFYMYARSTSKVSSTYSYKNYGSANQNTVILPNQLVLQTNVWKLLETPHNSLRILRYPAAVLNVDNTLSVIYDRYTTINGIKVLYYKQPQHFSLMTSTPCELPIDAFDDIVSGAVDLYVQYAAGAEANKRRQDEARRQQMKEEQKRRRDDRDDD